MGLRETIEKFNEQFSFEPKIENYRKINKKKFLLVGMGGSHLAGDIFKIYQPQIDLLIHKDYGLPKISDLKERLIILSSYSGNTEEVIKAYQEAKQKKINFLVICTNGKLLSMAQKEKVPYLQLPKIEIQPRHALGFSFRALLYVLGDKKALVQTKKLQQELKPRDFEKEGKKWAQYLTNSIPVIYSSSKNEPIAYNWKIKFNETGKIPAFFNVFPELNHNEMTGFDVKKKTFFLSKIFSFIFLFDGEDDIKIKKRMLIMKRLFEKRKLKVKIFEMKGKNIFHKIFSSLLVADWASYYLAQKYGVEAEKVPMVEEFKKLIR